MREPTYYILAALLDGPMHGYAIIKHAAQASQGRVNLAVGTLYGGLDRVQIRAGLHIGEVELRGDDVGGIAVHIAARVMATAGAGEIVVSRTVHDLVAGSEVVLQDRGIQRLKGVEGDWQLFVVGR